MTEEFSPGVKIILDRIREFPDDFSSGKDAWYSEDKASWPNMAAHIMREKDTFTDEERKAVRNALGDARRADIDASVAELLAEPPKKKVVITRANSLLTSANMVNQAKKLLEMQFDQEYAKAIPKMEGDKV